MAMVVLLALTGCPRREPVPPPTPAADAGAEPTCEAWCTHAAVLGCPSAKPTPRGSPCVRVCENIQKSGVVSWNLACRVAAATCEAADACER